MPTIFVSYSHHDRDHAEFMTTVLKRFDENYDIWWDFQLRGGANWRETIEKEIRNRDIFVFLMSPDSMSSEYCQQELRIARDAERFMLPVIVAQPIDNSQMPEDVSDYLDAYQYIDLSLEDKSLELTKLFNALKWFEESMAETSMNSVQIAAEVARAMQAKAKQGLNIPDFNTAETRRARSVPPARWAIDPPSQPRRHGNENRRAVIIGLTIGFVVVAFFSVIFVVSFASNFISSANATSEFATAVEERIITRNANQTSVAAAQVTETPTRTPQPTIDRTATAQLLATIDQQDTKQAATLEEQGTREAATATALFETQSAQLTDDAPTNTALPSPTALPSLTPTPTASNTPIPTVDRTATAQFELDASSTAIAQQTNAIIEQTIVYQTAAAEEQAVATQRAAEATVVFPDGRLVQLYYNDGSFYMRNSSSRAIRLSRIGFQALNAEGEAIEGAFFDGEQWAAAAHYNFLDQGGRCVAIELYGLVHLDPADCVPVANINTQYNALLARSINTSSVFWRPNTEITHFAVLWRDQEIARCPTENQFCEVRIGN